MLGLACASQASHAQVHFRAVTPTVFSPPGAFLGQSVGFADGSFVGTSTSADGTTQRMWLFDPDPASIAPIGLDTGEHRSASGVVWQEPQMSGVAFDPGVAVGSSRRFVGDLENGQSVWAFVRATQQTHQLGLLDSEHTRASDGRRVSIVTHIGKSGLVFGTSERFAAPDRVTRTAWTWSPGSLQTRRAGLLDSVHRSPFDPGVSRAQLVKSNAAGASVGHNELYVLTGPAGQSAWIDLDDGGGARRIGLLDAAHVDPASGTHVSVVVALTESGWTAGTSNRYLDGRFKGESTWIRHPVTGATSRIGLFDAEHTSATGLQNSRIMQLYEDGSVLGVSSIFDGSLQNRGQTAWLYNPATAALTRLGLTGPQYRSSTTQSRFTSVSWQGRTQLFDHVVGTTTEYAPSGGVLRDVPWAWTRATGVIRPLTFSNFTVQLGGWLQSRYFVCDADEAGRGTSAIVFDSNDWSSTRVGLYSGPFVSPTGRYRTLANNTFDGPLLVGVSTRQISPQVDVPWQYDYATQELRYWDLTPHFPATWTSVWHAGVVRTDSGDAFVNISGWRSSIGGSATRAFMVTASNAVTPVILSSSSTGDWESSVNGMTASGVVYGTYRDMSTPGRFIKLFVWTPASGFQTESEFITGDWPAFDTDWVYFAPRSDDNIWVTRTSYATPNHTSSHAVLLPRICDPIDFNNDGSSFDPQDIDAFLSVFSEGPCIPSTATCNDIDFNNDGVFFDPCDTDAFNLMFQEGPCTACGQ